MTDLTSLDLETTALARGANQLGLTALVECGRQIHDGDPAWFLGLLRDFDKLAAEILRLRALIAPGEGCETTEEERKAVPTWRAINGDSPFMARLLRDLARAEARANEAAAALAAAEEREAEWAKGRRPFQNQNAVIAAQVKRIDDLNAALAAEKERAAAAEERAHYATGVPSLDELVEVGARVYAKQAFDVEFDELPHRYQDRARSFSRAILTAVLPRVVGAAVETLGRSETALNDWCVTYAADHCDAASVKEAWARIIENAGTLAYIAHLTDDIRTVSDQLRALGGG